MHHTDGWSSQCRPKRRKSSRIGFCVGNEFANIVGWNRRVQHHRIGHVSEQRYRREIVHAIKRHCCKQRMIHGVHAHRIEQERVTVRRRSRHDSRANVARRSRAVLDDDRLTERLVQVVGNDARQNVGRSAGREWHDERNGTIRIGRSADFCQRRGRRTAGHTTEDDASIMLCH